MIHIMSKKNFSLIFFFLFFLSVNIFGKNLDFEIDFYLDSELYSVLDLMNENYFYPLDIIDENLLFSLEQKYSFNFSNYDIDFGYIRIYERNIKIDKKTINFLYDVGKGRLIKNNYDLKLDTWKQTVDGIFLGKDIYIDDYDLKIAVFAKLLRGINLERSYYNGDISFRNGRPVLDGYRKSTYSFVGQETRQEGINFYSLGLSMDLMLDWQINELENLSLVFKDIYSYIYWHDLYTNTGSYTSDNIRFEENFIKHLPSYSGRYFYKDYYSKLRPEINFRYNRDRLKGGLLIRNKNIPYITYQICQKNIKGEALEITAGLYGEQKQFELKYSNLSLMLSTDNLNLSKSNSLAAYFRLDIDF